VTIDTGLHNLLRVASQGLVPRHVRRAVVLTVNVVMLSGETLVYITSGIKVWDSSGGKIAVRRLNLSGSGCCRG